MLPARGLKIAGSAKHGMVAAMAETAPGSNDPLPEGLSSDRRALQALVRELMARCEKLEHLLRVARNAQYGRSSVSTAV